MDTIAEMMVYQGGVKVTLMQKGIPQDIAHELARDIASKTFTSPLVTEEVRKIYSNMTGEN